MELNTTKSEILLKEKSRMFYSDLGLESDFILPDYLGEIKRVLKCVLTPRILTKNLDGSHLSLSGTAYLRLVYCDEGGNLRSFEEQLPFSKTIEVMEGENINFTVSALCDYVNCRVVSPRRFEVRAAIKIKANVWQNNLKEYLENIETEGAETKTKALNLTTPIECVRDDFSVMEEYDLSGEAISSIIKMNAFCELEESKIISGKVILKGKISISLLYIGEESGETNCLDYVLPVNRIILAENAEEGDELNISLDISRVCAESGSKGELSVEVFLSVCAEILRKQTISPVCDAFFVGHESSPKKKTLKICELEKHFQKKHTQTIDCDDSGEVVDCFFDVKDISHNIKESGEITADISGLVTFLIKKEDDIEKSEKHISVPLSIAADEGLSGADCICEVTGFDCKKHSGKNAAEITLFVNCKAEKFCEEEILENLIVNDEKLFNDKKTAVCIYFAEAGEDIFEIAKSHNSSALGILKENGLEDFEIKKRQPILIPMA